MRCRPLGCQNFTSITYVFCQPSCSCGRWKLKQNLLLVWSYAYLCSVFFFSNPHYVCKGITVTNLLGEKGAVDKLQRGLQLRWLNTIHGNVFAHICSCETEGSEQKRRSHRNKRKLAPLPNLPWEVCCFGVCQTVWTGDKANPPEHREDPLPTLPPLPAFRTDTGCSAPLLSSHVV